VISTFVWSSNVIPTRAFAVTTESFISTPVFTALGMLSLSLCISTMPVCSVTLPISASDVDVIIKLEPTEIKRIRKI